MNNSNQITRKMKGGVIASIITVIFAILTIGMGVAFGAEGGIAGLVKSAVGEVASTTAGLAKGSGIMLFAESTGTPMNAKVTLRLVDTSDPVHVPEAVVIKLLDSDGSTVLSQKTVHSTDSNVSVANNVMTIADAWTAADGVDVPSAEGDVKFVAEASGWIFGQQGASFSEASWVNVTPYVNTTGINAALKYYPVNATDTYTVSAVWDDGDDGLYLPNDTNYGGGTQRFQFEYSSNPTGVAGSDYLARSSNWTTSISIPADWEGDSLSYDFSTRFSFKQISANPRYEVVSTTVDDVNKTVVFHLHKVNDANSLSIPVNITWSDDDDAYGLRPSTLKVRAYSNQNALADGSLNVNQPIGEYEFSEGESWAHTFTSLSGKMGTQYSFDRLPATDENGNPVEYTFKQMDGSYPQSDDTKKFIAYYASSGADNVAVTYDGVNNVVLDYHLATMPSEVTVTWDDDNNSANKRPSSVTVNVSLNVGADRYTNTPGSGTRTVQLVLTDADVDPNDSNVWKKEFNFVVITENGNYCTANGGVTEDAIADYESTITTHAHKGYATAGINVVNSYDPPTGSLTVTKTVSGALADTDKKFQFTVLLSDNSINGTYGDMEFTNGVATFPLKHNQSVTATKLPAGTSFSVSEGSVGNYVASWVNQSGTITQGTTMFSTCNNEYQTVTFNVDKVWDDNNNSAGNRPASIIVEVYANGDRSNPAATEVLNSSNAISANTWRAGFILPANKETDNSPITYTVDESSVPVGYKSAVSGDATNGFYITNTTETVDLNVRKVWNDSNMSRRPSFLTFYLKTDGTVDQLQSVVLNDTDTVYGTSNIWEKPNAFTGLPAYRNGYPVDYSVEEETVVGYTQTDLKVVDSTVTITNKANPVGNLNVGKLVSGTGGDQSKQFTFTVIIEDYPGGGADQTINGPYGEMYFTNGVATFPLRHGETIHGMDLPAEKTYQVFEVNEPGYTPDWMNQFGSIVEGTTTDVVCANVYTPPTGNLTVAKTVSGAGADQSQAFQFTVLLSDNSINGPYGDMYFTNGIATFPLTHGQSATATSLPAGTSYSVSESSEPNYAPSWTNESGTIASGSTMTASCENVYTSPYVSPETSTFTVTRDDDGESADTASMTLVETVPQEVPVNRLNLSTLKMTVAEPTVEITPTADPTNNTLTYSFGLSDGQTVSVNLIRNSSVLLTNNSDSVDMEQTDGSGSLGSSFTVGSTSPTLMLSAENTSGSGQQSGQSGRRQGWIRVNTNDDVNTAVSYEAFKVFDADVVNDNGEYKGTHITWASDGIKSTVMGYVNNNDYKAWLATKYGKSVGELITAEMENPQNVAEWIAIKVADSTEDTTANTTPKTTKGDTFASELAATLRNSGAQSIPVPANTVTPVDQGYYVVATATSSIDNDEAGTAPIWAPVPETGYTVEEKVSKPIFDKRVKDNTDDTTNYNKVADASTGQWLDFKLTTTLPANLEAFPAYPLTVVDVLPNGMDATISTDNGFSVYLGETEITEFATSTLVEKTLTVSVADILDDETLGVSATGSMPLAINYRAKLNENSVKGSAGNENTATLTYPADPLVPATTAQLTSSATVLTYQIRVDKVDEANRLNVDGAKFAVQTTVSGTTYWVKSDGSLTTNQAERGEWTTTNGYLTVTGLDEGTYTFHEIEAPNLYETIASPLVVELNAVKDYAQGSLTSLSATASGANGTLVSNPSATQDGVVGTDQNTGVAEIRISDVKQIVLPLTGMPVKVVGIIAGVVIAIASAIAFVVNKRRNDDEEEETEE